jgi:outer membrane protein OmpA-like peptidoglycan-associated protein/tetratricopeptide (TPR) repeat protein
MLSPQNHYLSAQKKHMNRLRSVICLFVFVLVSPALWAQKAAELKKNGEKAFANERWADALALLSQYQQEKPGDPAVLTKLGIAHYHLHQPDKARQYLEYVAKQNPNSQDAELFLYLARTLHGQQEFERAIPAYKSFLRVCGEKHPLRAGIPDQIRRCVSGMAIQPNDNVALVENLGDRVNSAGDEFAPLISPNNPNRLYFSAAREGCNGGRRNDAGLADSVAGHWCSDIFFTNQTTSGWEYATSLSGLLNTSRHEVALGFARKGQVLFYFRGFTPYSGDVFADTAGRKDEYAVSPPTFVSPMKAEEGDCNPFFFNDSTLIFASRRAGGQGGLDLYITTFSDSAWTEPRNLGVPVNSPYDETSPFLARDGRTLYFSSNRTESMGGLDVFKTVFEDEKLAWQAPANLGTPINSPGDDAFFSLATDGRTAVFSSDRLDSYGERDLYIVYFKEEMAEQTRTREPNSFLEVEKLAANVNKAELETKSAAIPALFYNSDKDVLSPENLKVIEDAAALARQMPQATVLVTCHTDETGAAKFDLYYGIKRAELVGKALIERGVAASRVVLLSCGPNYPLVRTIIEATPNPQAAKMNRRIEISLATLGEKLPVEVTVPRPEVSDLMAAPGAKFFDENTKGLFFRVEVATTRQILTNDALAMFSDLMIESQPATGSYRYSAGLLKQHDKAVQLKKDLQKQGFEEATVVAYIDGIRVSKAEAVGLLKKYPDLAAYVRG